MSDHVNYEGFTSEENLEDAEGVPYTDFLNDDGQWMEWDNLESFAMNYTPSEAAQPVPEEPPLVEEPPALDPEARGPTVQVSNTFYAQAHLDASPPNVVLVSSDEIFFLVHYHRLVSASSNSFGGLLAASMDPSGGDPLTFAVPEPSDILNVVLHCIYNLSCDNYHPTFEGLSASLPSLEKYGLALPDYLARGTPLYNTILNFAPFRPLETYTLAASHALEDLAVAASAYTLHIKVHSIPHNLADQMDVSYLQRLHHLHRSRISRLKALLDESPFPHEEKPYCSVEQRQVLSRAYHFAGSQVFYDATPATSRSGIEMVMRGLIEALSCPDCKASLTTHVDEMVKKWMLFTRTI
ncbi:hypothetical protein BC629DRAFT_1593236 [Irpex lacteus]|nr:hypothetical protein BC629DRAFT_1593236 [Irpex lacteus]